MYSPLSPVFCTASSSSRLALVSRRPIIRATANPARPAMISSSSMTSRSPLLPTMMMVMPPTPASAVMMVTAEIRVSSSPIDRRAIACMAKMPTMMATTAMMAAVMDTWSRSDQATSGRGPARMPAAAEECIYAASGSYR